MVTKGNRLSGQPTIVHGDLTQKLERVSFLAGTFKEDWIQQLVHEQSHILPIDDIEGNFSPLIPIGREIRTPVGFIDNLFISPSGYITIIETKLWRNPEARREVVGQILDYAKELNKWTFTDLDNAAKQYNQQNHGNTEGLLSTIRHYELIDESDERYFIDSISKNLKRGRFLLLIVGDGIRESVEDMIEYLSHTPQLYFTLALIELQVYLLDKEKKSFVIIPQIIARTKEITRAIVRIEGSIPEHIEVNVETILPEEESPKTTSKRYTITEEDFFDQLQNNTDRSQVEFAKKIIADSEQRGYYIDWRQGSFVVKLIDPSGSGNKITLFIIDKKGMVAIGYSAKQLQKIQVPVELSYSYAADTAKLFKNLSIHNNYMHMWNKDITLNELKLVYELFIERVDQFVQDIIKSIEESTL